LQVLCLSCSTVRMEHAIADGLDDLWEAPAPEQESHACEVVAYPPRTAMELVEAAELSDHDRLQKLENEIFAENLVIVMDATRFREIPPDAKEPLPEWIAELGPTEAWKRFRVAQAAWMGAKDAPVGISIAAQTGPWRCREKSGEGSRSQVHLRPRGARAAASARHACRGAVLAVDRVHVPRVRKDPGCWKARVCA
jgi:hypothetical protein